MNAGLALLLAAVGIGAALPLQSVVNARLASLQEHPLHAALANTAGGLLCLLLLALALALRVPAPLWRAATGAPWWLWVGGPIGAAFVFAALYVTPRLGASAFVAATVLGSAVASLAIDHYGWFGLAVRPLGLQRFIGAGCLLAGIALLQSGRS